MGENKVRHLPVVGDGKRMLGLITRQALLIDPARLGSLDLWEIARTLSGLSAIVDVRENWANTEPSTDEE